LQYAFDGEQKLGDGNGNYSPMSELVYQTRDRLKNTVTKLEAAHNLIADVLR
jgi:hypothetical protein